MYLDDTIGELINVLEDEGWMENSIIVVASDNGGCPKHGGSNYPLRGTKYSYWEGGNKVQQCWTFDGPIFGVHILQFLVGQAFVEKNTLSTSCSSVRASLLFGGMWKDEAGVLFSAPEQIRSVSSPCRWSLHVLLIGVSARVMFQHACLSLRGVFERVAGCFSLATFPLGQLKYSFLVDVGCVLGVCLS